MRQQQQRTYMTHTVTSSCGETLGAVISAASTAGDDPSDRSSRARSGSLKRCWCYKDAYKSQNIHTPRHYYRHCIDHRREWGWVGCLCAFVLAFDYYRSYERPLIMPQMTLALFSAQGTLFICYFSSSLYRHCGRRGLNTHTRAALTDRIRFVRQRTLSFAK